MKPSCLRFVAVCCLLFAGTVQAQPEITVAAWTGETDQKVFGLMTVWAEARYTFPHFDRRPELDWDATVQSYIPRVIAAPDMESYYQVLLELVALLKDSHTTIVPPWGELKPGWDLAPIEVMVLNDRFYVDRVGGQPALADQGVVPGAEILAVDGEPVGQYFAENVLRYHSAGSKQADQSSLLAYLLYGPAGSSRQLQVRGLDGVTHEATVTLDAMSGEGGPFMTRMLANLFAGPTIRARMLPGGIQYVEVPNFEHPEVRTDFEAMIDGLDASTCSGMIIDLRYNLGGDSAIAEPMVACLIDKTVPSPTMKYRHFVGAFEAWGRDPIWETTTNLIPPREGARFAGPVVVLTSGYTNSSAEDFAIELRTAGRAKWVGQRTAGGAGNALVSALPGGGSLRVATFTALTPEGVDYVGVGVMPDVEVWPTPADLAAGRDPVLERAVKLLGDR